MEQGRKKAKRIWLKHKEEDHIDRAIEDDSDKTSLEAYINGILGEMALAKYYDVKVDTGWKPDGDKQDFFVKIGGVRKKLDVKTTTYTRDPILFVRKDYIDKCDVYFLVLKKSDMEFYLMGWQTKEYLKGKEPVESRKPSKNHLNYEVGKEELRDVFDKP